GSFITALNADFASDGHEVGRLVHFDSEGIPLSRYDVSNAAIGELRLLTSGELAVVAVGRPNNPTHADDLAPREGLLVVLNQDLEPQWSLGFAENPGRVVPSDD